MDVAWQLYDGQAAKKAAIDTQVQEAHDLIPELGFLLATLHTLLYLDDDAFTSYVPAEEVRVVPDDFKQSFARILSGRPWRASSSTPDPPPPDDVAGLVSLLERLSKQLGLRMP